MKLLALSGSPHKNGNTQKLIDSFLSSAPPDTELGFYRAFEESFLPCDDCKACAEKFGCVKPDHKEFFDFLEQADYVLIGTPVYLYSFPAPLKAVFDRFEQYYSARFSLNMRPPIQKSKKAFLILTQGSADDESLDIITKQCRTAFSVMNTKLQETYIFKNADRKDSLISVAQEEIAKAAMAFFKNSH